MQRLVSFLVQNLDAMVEELLKEYDRCLERYRAASPAEKESIRNYTRKNLQFLLQRLRGKDTDKAQLDLSLIELGEKRAHQGFPLAELVETFHFAHDVIYRYVKKALQLYPEFQAKQLLKFDLIVTEMFNHIDMGVVKPYLQFQENIIQTQQSFLKHKFSSLFKLVEAISNNLNIQEFCEILLDYLCKFYDVKVTAIFLMDERGRELYPQHATGFSRRFLREQRFSISAHPFKQCLDSGHVMILTDHPYTPDDLTIPIPANEPAATESQPKTKPSSRKRKNTAAKKFSNPVCYSLYAPMIGRQRTYGMVALHSLQFRKYTPLELQQLETLARIVAVALENARFYDNLIEEKGKLDAIVNSISDGLILTNFHEEIVFINEQAARYLHLPVSKLIGASAALIPERLLENAKEPHTIQAAYLRALMNIVDHPVLDFTLYRPLVTDIRLTMFPVKDRDQRFIGRGLIIEDISREKEINRLKSEFVAITSHTMRTPMTSILGFASLLNERELPAEIQKKYLNNICRESQRLMNILNDMLDLANIEAGRISLKLASMDLAKIASESIKEVQNQNKRDMVLKIAAQLPKIIADPEKLRQVFQNLLNNAVKYSSGKIAISIQVWNSTHFRTGWQRSNIVLDSPSYFPAVAVCLEDQGEGIPLDQLDEIFEPFHRVDNERTQKNAGSGLGLTIVRYIVEAHGGKIWVESKAGKGSIFTFILPLELSRPDRDLGRLAS